MNVILDGTEEEITFLHELLVLPEVLWRLANVGVAERMQDVPFALGGIRMEGGTRHSCQRSLVTEFQESASNRSG